MDFAFSHEEEDFKNRVDELLKNDPAVEGMSKETDSGLGWGPYTWEILRKLGAKGMLAPHWPVDYGGLGLSQMYRYIVFEEIERFGGPYCPAAVGIVGPVILRLGTTEQKNEYLPRAAKGEIEFALGYTEVEAGSDLANLSTRAEDKGDYYLVNGMKRFSARAHFSHYHFLAARTDKTAPKHRGISLFIVDLKSPGITIDPLLVMGGNKAFRVNEVFYDDVKVPKNSLVGEKNRGFYHIMESLVDERTYAMSGISRRIDKLIEYAKETGKTKCSVVRQNLAQLKIEAEKAKLFTLRVPWMQKMGIHPAIEAPMTKIIYDELEEKYAITGTEIFGQLGILHQDSKWSLLNGEIEMEIRRFLSNRVEAGTPEIMRNIIAQRGLGL